MKKLSWTQRIALAEGIKAGKSNAQIAREIGVHRSTVGREIARNADARENYAPLEADLKFWQRQKEAVTKRFLITFCGVEFYTKLQKQNRIYTYISRTHLNTLSRYKDHLSNGWEIPYPQFIKNRLMPGYAFMRIPAEGFPAISFTQACSGSQFSDSFFSFRAFYYPGISPQHLFKLLNSSFSGRMSFSSGLKQTASSTDYTGQTVYELYDNGLDSTELREQKVFVSYFFIHRKQKQIDYVSFSKKNEKVHTNSNVYLLKKRTLVIKK